MDSQCTRHHRHTVGTHHTFANVPVPAAAWLHWDGCGCRGRHSAASAYLTGDSRARRPVDLCVSWRPFFHSCPLLNTRKWGSSYFLWPTLERAQVFCSQAPLPLLEFCSYPPLWTWPRGHELFSRAQQYLIFLSLFIWSRRSLSPLGPGGPSPTVRCFSRSFFFGLGVSFGKSKARDLGHILCSLWGHVFPWGSMCCCFNVENVKGYEELWGKNNPPNIPSTTLYKRWANVKGMKSIIVTPVSKVTLQSLSVHYWF